MRQRRPQPIRGGKGMPEGDEEWRRALFDKYVDGVALVVDGRVDYTNPALIRMTGYSLEEARGRPPSEFVIPEDRAGFE